MHSDGRFVQTGQPAYLTRRTSFQLTQHEQQDAPPGQLSQRRMQSPAPFLPEHVLLGAWAPRRQEFRRIVLDSRRVDGRRGNPLLPTLPLLDPIQASINQDAREPDLKWELLAKRPEVG